jgi:HAD superfamily hydrolase (TIGR01509 family)
MTELSYRPAVLLDLDGTLIDSVFHHVLAWDEALTAHGYSVPLWRIHAGIGMGSSRLVPWLLGRHPEDTEALTEAHEERFLARAELLRRTDGALELVEDLEVRGIAFQVATSATGTMQDALLEALGRKDLPTANADDVGSAKPAPDLLLTACQALSVEPTDVTLIGDSPWDAEAADRIGLRMLAVRCGGFGDQRLLDAGATDVVDHPGALVGRL